MDKENLMKTVSENLSSVLVSVKGGVLLNNVQRDYRELVGSAIEYRKMGYSTLEAMLRDMPNVVEVVKDPVTRELKVFAIADEKTRHIQKMVSRQKDTKSKGGMQKKFRMSSSRFSYASSYSSVPRKFSRPPGGGGGRRVLYDAPPSRSSSSPKTGMPSKVSVPDHLQKTLITQKKSYYQEPSSREVSLHTSSLPPQPQLSSSALAAGASKKGLTLSKTNYEVPPRFLRQQKFHVDNSSLSSGRSSPNVVEEAVIKSIPAASTKSEPAASTKSESVASTKSEPVAAAKSECCTTERRASTATIRAPTPSRSGIRSPTPPTLNRSTSLDPDSKPYFPPAAPMTSSRLPMDSIAQPQLPGLQQKPVKAKRASAVMLPPLPSQLSSKERVKQYANTNSLTVEYKTKPTKNGEFYSVLHLGESKYYSYHAETAREARSVQDAEELAASLALDRIEEENKKRYPETVLNSSEDIQMFVGRIETILSEIPGGVWSHGMLNKYKDRYQESLPENWLSIIETNSTIIEFERSSEARLEIPHNACILRISKMSSGATTPTSTSSRTSFSMEEDQHHQVLAHVNSEHNPLVSGAGTAQSTRLLPPLILPDETEWMVYVCCVESTVNIAVSLVEYNLQLEAMFVEMNEFYSIDRPPVHRVIRSKLYAALNEGAWQRVSVKDVATDVAANEVTCYLIDCGAISQKSISDLRELDPRFEVLPPQAIHIMLHDLENYSEIVDSRLLESLLDRTYIAKVIERRPNIVVELYDTHGNDDINLNLELKRKTLESLILAGSLPEVGKFGSFSLIHASPNGILYFHSINSALEILNAEMEKMALLFEAGAGKVPEQLSPEKVYAVKYPIDDTWVRAIHTGFTEPPTETKPFEVEMFFSDYGNSLTVPLSSVSEIPDWLADLPKLAVECVLTGVPPCPDLVWSNKCSDKLYELSPDMEQLTLRVDEPATEELPARVNLHRRNTENHFISINTFFMVNQDLFDKIEEKPDYSQGLVISPLLQSPSSDFPITDGAYFNHVGSALGSGDASIVPTGAIEDPIRDFHTLNINSEPVIGANGDVGLDRPTSNESDPIPDAEIPEVGEFLDVYIPMAASPSNFVVQPMKTAKALDDLVNEMNRFYSTEENLIDMDYFLLQNVNYFAALHTDGSWYRVKLVGRLNKGADMVTVHFVDFGDFVMMPMNKLQPLWKKYKALPCQAIKATLSGVKPCYRDWDTHDCIEFGNIVKEKMFVSQVMGIIPREERDWPSFILELSLIDTSDPVKDIDISDLLIENILAVKA